MRVALAVDALSPELTGVGRYCWELASRLPAEPDVTCVRYFEGPHWHRDPATLLQPRAAVRRTWRRRFARWAGKNGLDAVRRPNVDLVHGPNFLLPRWAKRGIVTVHDLSVFRYPDTHPAARIEAFNRSFARSVGQAVHLITPSETVRQEVIAFTGRSAAEVTAVHNGIDERLRPWTPDERAPVLQRLGLPSSGYGLTLSALEPRKRIDRLVDAWQALPPGLRSRFPLVVAGAPGWRNEALRARIERGAGEGWLIPLGFVADDDLPALYSGAHLFAYPSIYEGFGLPPVEAMACGVPTVVANASCLPEVTAGAAMLSQPDDLLAFAADLGRALIDEAWRGDAVTRGLQVAGRYTWARCVRETIAVYRRVLESSSASSR